MEEIDISQVKELPLSSYMIDEMFFLDMKPDQVIAYCEAKVADREREVNNKIPLYCENIYIWRKYFWKHFTWEYNEYIHSLLAIYDETSEFYLDRLKYIDLRNKYPLLANIKGIRRDKSDAVQGFQLVKEGKVLKVVGEVPSSHRWRTVDYIDMDSVDESNLQDILRHIINIRDFRSFYQIVTHKLTNYSYDNNNYNNIWRAISFVFIDFLNDEGQEQNLPLEFIELAYLKMHMDFTAAMKKVWILYGTSYYLDSIRPMINKNIFNDLVSGYIETDDNSNLNVIGSFVSFANMYFRTTPHKMITPFKNFVFDYGKKKQLIFREGDDIFLGMYDMPSHEEMEKVLVFFDLSLRYLLASGITNAKYDIRTIRKGYMVIEKIIKDIEFEEMEDESSDLE